MQETLSIMKYDIEIKDYADQEIMVAYIYYQDKRIGLGEEFLDHLTTYFNRIRKYPEHFPQKQKPYREAFIKRFPFLIIYEIEETKIVVYSVFNTWQSPKKKWK